MNSNIIRQEANTTITHGLLQLTTAIMVMLACRKNTAALPVRLCLSGEPSQ
jgi:hypothetical protein